jgi:glutamate 5-kinase
MSTKLEAAKLATSSGVATVICNGWERDVLSRLARGEELGTMFPPTSSRLESRKRWMLSELSTRGEIVVDQGAALALRGHNSSLLPVGVKGIKGEFHRGDIVYVVALGAEKVACGIVSYSSQDITRIKGVRSDRIQSVLGYHYGQEVVHRNNMVLL